MSIWIKLLLFAVAKIIAYLMSRRGEYEPLSDSDRGRLNEALDKTREMDRLAVSMGCKPRENRGGEAW